MEEPEYKDQDFYCSFTHLPNIENTDLDQLPYTLSSPHSSFSSSSSSPFPGVFIRSQSFNLHRMSNYTYNGRFSPASSRMNSVDSTSYSPSFDYSHSARSSTYRSFSSNLSTACSVRSTRTQRIIDKIKQPFLSPASSSRPTSSAGSSIISKRSNRRSRMPRLLSPSKRQSTLDFSCCGTEDASFLSPKSATTLLTNSTPSIIATEVSESPTFRMPVYEEAPKLNWKAPRISREDWSTHWFDGIQS